MTKLFGKVHFVGIGGTGMCGMAEVLLNDGYRVSGSDLRRTEVTERLEKLGGEVHIGHDPAHIAGADVVVVSSAVPPGNAEVAEARRLRVPVIPRQEMLAELMRMKRSIAVSGAHGKTTTTSMVGHILHEAGMDPTVVLGGRLSTLGSHARLGQGEYLVAEADESDRTFLKLLPHMVIITNMDREHMDTYRDMDDMRSAYLEFANKVPFFGKVILCLDDENLQGLLPELSRRVITYGMSAQADLYAANMRLSGLASAFDVKTAGGALGAFRLSVPGRHNVLNALAAIAVGRELGVDTATLARTLASFPGADRRFQRKGEARGITVIDDYAHHPTEIRATLAAARDGWAGRVVAVFQPHRYTRVRDMADGFARSFNDADAVMVLPIYPAGEAPIAGVGADLLAEAIRAHGHRDVELAAGRDEAVRALVKLARRGDMIITLGAGDVHRVGTGLLRALEEGA